MKHLFTLKTIMLACLLFVGMGAWAEEYSFTIQTSDFNTTSYAANNGSHDFTATCKTDASKTMVVACTSNQVMQSSSVMQWQKNAGYIYNTTDLGTIKSVTVNSSAGTFTTNYGTTEHPTSGTTVGNGYFTVSVGNATGKTSSIVVVFEKTTGGDPTPEPTKYNVTVANNITNGTVTASPTSAAEGATVTLTATPSTGYMFGSWNVTNASTSSAITVTDNKFTMPAANVNVSATFAAIPTHTAHFSVNGTIDPANDASIAEGESITFPANPAVEDVAFMGWATAAIVGTQDAAPSFVNTATETMGNADVTYYAVFATEESGTAWKLVSSLTNGKEYVFATKNVAGSAYALSSNVTTGTSVTIAESGTDKIISGTPANTIIWTVATGWSLTNKGVDTNNKLTINGSTFAINGTGSSNLSWTTNYGLNGQSSSGSTKYYVQCTNTGTFSKSSTSGSTTNRVYAYEKSEDYTYSAYCTTVAVREISDIAVKTAPTTVAYCEGENFDPAGLEITVNYADGGSEDVTYTGNESKFGFSPSLDAALALANDHVTITYKGKNCQQAISVRTVSIVAPVVSEGTYTVKVGDAAAVTADGSTINALKGQKIVLASTPAAGYKLHSTPFVVTDEDDADVNVSTAGGQYSFTMPGKNVTITAQFTQVYTITAGSCEHGSITAIKDKDDAEITETSYRSKVVVEATADTHYHLTGMYYVKEGDDAHNEIGETEGIYSFTMPQSNVTVYATFAADAQYTVSWMVNGAEAKSEQVYTGVPVSAPAVAPVNGKVFRGWVAEEIDGTQAQAPAYVDVSNLTVTEDKVFYAVFATEDGVPETWTEITTAPEEGTYAIYANLHFMKASVSSNRFENAACDGQEIVDGKLIIAPEADCVWEISKPDTYYRIKNGTKYAGGTGSKNQGALLEDASADLAKWTISYTNDQFEIINYGRSQASSDNGNKYLRNNGSNGWATYASGTGDAPHLFKKEGGMTYSDYCTTVAAPVYNEQSLTLAATDGTDYYATFSSSSVTFWPSMDGDMEYATEVKKVSVDGSALTLTNLDEEEGYDGLDGYFVPANTGVLVKVDFDKAEKTVPYYTVTNKNVAALENNALIAGTGSTPTDGDEFKYYKLAYDAENASDLSTLGFYWGANDGAPFNLTVGKAYLKVAKNAGVKSFRFGGNTTGIKTVNNGQAINKAVKRIMNGQLVIEKAGKMYNAAGAEMK